MFDRLAHSTTLHPSSRQKFSDFKIQTFLSALKVQCLIFALISVSVIRQQLVDKFNNDVSYRVENMYVDSILILNKLLNNY